MMHMIRPRVTTSIMWCRFCTAARAALHSAEPQHPGFLELALRHRYPLRHLSTAELPLCELDSFIAKVRGIASGSSCMRHITQQLQLQVQLQLQLHPHSQGYRCIQVCRSVSQNAIRTAIDKTLRLRCQHRTGAQQPDGIGSRRADDCAAV